MKKSLQPVIFIVALCLIGIVAFVGFNYTGTRSIDSIDATETMETRQLNGVEILETTDLSGAAPRFRLNVQTHSMNAVDPLKVELIKKSDNSVVIELPLSPSRYPAECMKHNQMDASDPLGTMMKKWNTDWFTIPAIASVNLEYSPKLAEAYSVQVMYTDGSAAQYLSKHEVEAVCYQITQSEEMQPQSETIKKED